MSRYALPIDGLRKAIGQLPQNALSATREAALANLDESGWPTLSDEDWKYTDLAAAVEISNRWIASGAANNASETLSHAAATITCSVDANWLVIENGKIDLSRFSSVSGIEIERFSESGAPALLDRPLADLNVALLDDGMRIRIHAATEKPLGILIIDEADDAAVSQANVEIEISPGCNAEIIEYQASMGSGRHYSNSVVTLHAQDGSQGRYVRIQNRQIGHVQTARLSVALEADSELQMSSYDIGGGLIRNDVEVDLSAPGANAELNGLYLAGDSQHVDNHLRVDHRVGPARSSQEYRGILNGRCRCVWNGKAIVHKGADGTDAKQANHNLLLSDQSEIDAKPELEIYAEDVKCAHGTTVGQLDENALFYLRTRGLDRGVATQVLTRAFASDLVRRVAVEAARDTVSALVERRLGDLIPEEKS